MGHEQPRTLRRHLPRDGSGAAYRAVRLKNIPAWVIHGSEDDVIFPGYGQQMVTALRAAAAPARSLDSPDALASCPESTL